MEQGWMVAISVLEAETCEGCGGDLAETLGTEPEDWIVLPPAVCGKCAQLGNAQQAYKGNDLAATRWLAKRRPQRGQVRSDG